MPPPMPGKWEKNKFMGVEIFAKTLGIIGCGNIGSIVADRAHRPEDEGDRLRSVSVGRARAPTLASRRSSSMSCSSAPISSRCTPRSPTRPSNIIDAAALAKMKKGVRIVNCARGGLVDEAAIAEALKSGHVAGAAFDVFAAEPATENPLFGLPNVVCTPHLGAATTRGAGKRRLAGRRTDVRLSFARRDLRTRSTSPRSAPKRRPGSSRSSHSPRSSARSPGN